MTGKFLSIDDDLTLHYEKSGQGPVTILLIPGWTMSTAVLPGSWRSSPNPPSTVALPTTRAPTARAAKPRAVIFTSSMGRT